MATGEQTFKHDEWSILDFFGPVPDRPQLLHHCGFHFRTHPTSDQNGSRVRNLCKLSLHCQLLPTSGYVRHEIRCGGTPCPIGPSQNPSSENPRPYLDVPCSSGHHPPSTKVGCHCHFLCHPTG